MLHLSQASVAAPLVGRSLLQQVSFDTFARRRVFADPALARRAADAMASLRKAHGARVLAWVLLPDRWSGIVAPAPRFPVGACVATLKAALSVAGSAAGSAGDPLWTNGFTARALVDDAALARAVEGVLLDPVSAGLARIRGEYAFWDAVWIDRVRERRDCIAELPQSP